MKPGLLRSHNPKSKCLLVKPGLLTIAQSEVDVSSGEAGSSWPGADDTTSAGVTTIAKAGGEARPLGIENQSATTESDIAVSSDEARPPGIEKQGATTEFDVAQSKWQEQCRRYSSREGCW